jgi:hypothetical protein
LSSLAKGRRETREERREEEEMERSCAKTSKMGGEFVRICMKVN